MTNYIHGVHIPTCDGCGDELAPERNASDANEAKKTAGWVRMRYEKGRCDYCPDCQRMLNEGSTKKSCKTALSTR